MQTPSRFQEDLLLWKYEILLWKLLIPHKVSIFCKCLLHGNLPLKGILVNTHIGLSGPCPICHQNSKDIRHLFFKCIQSQEFWNQLGLTGSIHSATNVDPSVIMEYILSIENTPLPLMPSLEVKQVIVVDCRYLWWTRHRITHNEICPPCGKMAYVRSSYHEQLPKSFNENY